VILTICRRKDKGIICKYLVFNIINTIIFQTTPGTFLKIFEKSPDFKTTNCDFDSRQYVNWWKERNGNFYKVNVWMGRKLYFSALQTHNSHFFTPQTTATNPQTPTPQIHLARDNFQQQARRSHSRKSKSKFLICGNN